MGQNTQNNNESFNATIWSLVRKDLFSGKKIVELSTWICACIFNEGPASFLKLCEIMGLEIGPHSYKYVHDKDEERVKCSEKRCPDASKQARMDQKKAAAEQEELFEQAFGLLYGPRMADRPILRSPGSTLELEPQKRYFFQGLRRYRTV